MQCVAYYCCRRITYLDSDRRYGRVMSFVSSLPRAAVLGLLGSKAGDAVGGLMSNYGNSGTLRNFLDDSSSEQEFYPFLKANPLCLVIFLYEVCPRSLWYISASFYFILHVYKIVDGVAWLHEQGFCHLDVKPENVVIHVS